jgi:hypothetical protein
MGWADGKLPESKNASGKLALTRWNHNYIQELLYTESNHLSSDISGGGQTGTLAEIFGGENRSVEPRQKRVKKTLDTDFSVIVNYNSKTHSRWSVT